MSSYFSRFLWNLHSKTSFFECINWDTNGEFSLSLSLQLEVPVDSYIDTSFIIVVYGKHAVSHLGKLAVRLTGLARKGEASALTNVCLFWGSGGC